MGRLARLLLALLATGGCRHDDPARPSAEQAVLERQRQGLEALIQSARKGPLVGFDQVLVVVDEKLLQDVLTASLPFERVVGGRYRVQLQAASVKLDDGFALVRLQGRASFADHDPAFASAEVTAFASLDVVELDPASGVLRGRVKVIAFEARRVSVMGADAPVRDLVTDLGKERLETFGALLSRLDIPVQFRDDVTIPSVGPGEVTIEAARIPVRASIADVKAFRGKLWIAVELVAGASARESPAPSRSQGGGR